MTEESLESPGQHDELVERLPLILAHPAHEFWNEPHPVQRLWHMCDFVELSLRLATFAAVGSHGSSLPPDLKRDLAEGLIERPTMGNWAGLAGAAVRHMLKESVLDFLPGLLSKLAEALGSWGDPPESSLLALRNRLAHGGGIGKKAASALLAGWLRRFEDLVAAHEPWGTFALVGRDQNGAGRTFRGPDCDGQPRLPADIPASLGAGELALVRADTVILLWPLAGCTVVEEAPVAEVYSRRGELSLEYTPLGGSAAIRYSEPTVVEKFVRLFGLDVREARKGDGVPGFEGEIRKEAARRVGRERELEALRVAVHALVNEPGERRHLWLHGAAGMGKSNLVASLVEGLLDDREFTRTVLLLPYRFRAGDARNDRGTFIRWAVDRLQSWDGLDPVEPDKELPETATPERRLGWLLERVAEGRLALFVLDGLDEIAERDCRFVRDIVLGPGGPRVAWLCAGRPEQGLPELFSKARQPFPGGLDRMSEDDVRSLLLERLARGRARHRLLDRDEEKGGRIRNVFLEKLAERSEGLPIYLNHALGDLQSGLLTPDQEGQLPRGLAGYHQRLLERCAVGDLQATVTPLVVLLAMAEEPLTPAECATLLARVGVHASPEQTLVDRALSTVQGMLRRAPDPDGEEGYTLFHHSLREHILGAASVRATVAMVRSGLAKAALRPEGDAAEVYLYRCGVRHRLAQDNRDGALDQLCDFAYVMARLRALGNGQAAVEGLYADWARVGTDSKERTPRIWWDLLRTNRHLLREANEQWGAEKILLQLAVEQANDSPVTQAADTWLAEGRCNWVWLKRAQRKEEWVPDPLLCVLQGHSGTVKGALALPNGEVLSWSNEDTLRVWDTAAAACKAVLRGHKGGVDGALVLPEGDILSWSNETLRVWDAATASCKAILKGHSDWVDGALVLPGGDLLSWSNDGVMKSWNAGTWTPRATFRGHSDSVEGMLALGNDDVLSWSNDHTFQVWDATTGTAKCSIQGHSEYVRGALLLPGGQFASWSNDDTFRVWDALTGSCRITLQGHTDTVEGALVLPGGDILSWSWDATLRLWDAATGFCKVVLEGHKGQVNGALVLPGGDILSWSEDGTMRAWNLATGACRAIFKGHSRSVIGAFAMPGGGVLSWSSDGTLRVWDATTGTCMNTLQGHSVPVIGAFALAGAVVVSWAEEQTLRVWDATPGHLRVPVRAGHSEKINGALVLSGGDVLSWSEDESLRIWDTASGACKATLQGHSYPVRGALVLPGGDVLSWSSDESARVWDTASGACKATLRGHSYPVRGALVLPGGDVLSWSEDKSLRVWDRASGACKATLQGHSYPVRGALVLPGGDVLSWSSDESARVWDTASGACKATLQGQSDKIEGALVLPWGDVLSWSSDQSLRVWDTASGVCRATPAFPSGTRELAVMGRFFLLGWDDVPGVRPSTGALLLDGGEVLSWTSDGKLLVWDATTWACLLSIPRARARRDRPDLYWAWQRAVTERAGNWIAGNWNSDRTSLILRDGRRIPWCATAGGKTKAVTGSGVAVFIRGSFLDICHLMYSNRRISLAEAEHVLAQLPQFEGPDRGFASG